MINLNEYKRLLDRSKWAVRKATDPELDMLKLELFQLESIMEVEALSLQATLEKLIDEIEREIK